MAVEIVMPRLSDSMEEGTILSWLVADGDSVEAGQPLVEIETDKATVTYEADDARGDPRAPRERRRPPWPSGRRSR